MGIKASVKKLIGAKNEYRVKVLKAHVKYLRTRKNTGIRMCSARWGEPKVYSLPDRHVFFGYYDLRQWKDGKLLVTTVPLKAQTARDPARLCWVEEDTGTFYQIAHTRAWCWQQGSRLRWHPVLPDTVMYNDVEGDRYVCRVVHLEKGPVAVHPRALYDVTPDGRFGLSLDYARLQRLRPGYGYDTLPDRSVGVCVPEEDGLIRVDLQTGEQKVLVSYRELVERSPEAASYENYVNHISVAPDGRRAMFFHLWKKDRRWDGRLYTVRLDGAELTCVAEGIIPSHYCWQGADRLMFTSVGFGGTASYYHSYDLTTGKLERLPGDHLKRDGHPTFFPEGGRFLSDTYPLEGSVQRLFLSGTDGTGYEPVCEAYSDPRMFDERRCDLHPRLSPDGRCITIDTTFLDGKRSVLLLRESVK